MSPKSKKPSVGLTSNDEEKILAKEIKLKKEQAMLEDRSFLYEEDVDEIDIRGDKYITVINLCSSELNLSTLPGGRGKAFTFNSFGDKKRIIYSNLVDIMEASPRFLEEGFYYIADKKVIYKHGLEGIYSQLLTKELIESIFLSSTTYEDIASLYKSTNKTQQELIVNLIIRKLIDGEKLDLNMVSSISNLSGVNILDKVEDAKFYLEPR